MRLSFSTMRLLHECPHNYVNKISGIKQPDSEALMEGRVAHDITQKHVSGRQPHELLSHIDLKFPVVEEVDFDDRCRFEVAWNGHTIFGFIDGADRPCSNAPTMTLECKFSVSPWSLKKFKDSPQRKIYSWALRSVETCYLITGKRSPEEWPFQPPVTRKVKVTEKDYKDAEEWMSEAIRKIEEKDFYGDLVNGKCVDPRCWWGDKCLFK